MEYSKEDLMEAKKQIWGVGENMGTEESKKIWEENAQFWDNAMGDESNEFHREVVRPKVTELLSVLLQCLFSRLISIFPQCGRMVFPGLVIMQSVM
ncbi:Methyltransferase domain-containing protein [Bifidobacterium pseudolongum subsp. globosum]|uniref:Methyltransferase domain-containing protein n=1 Tax=Bifidobacterium pseudolongum subsp. globosum TaxID=1690 RepID=A0A8B3RN63_9BIFI|nr:Methyltransferase domain-containing protein [Bifidobacterium pseudolongum subsp. globosum]